MSRLGRQDTTVLRKLGQIRWPFVLLLTMLGLVGAAILYSAADGSFEPWAIRHLMRFAVGIAVMLMVAMVDVRVWLRFAYVFYALSIVLLIGVEVAGTVGMGAQRWIDLGFINLQPSELMKMALVLALARLFHGMRPEEVRRPLKLVIPALLVLVPTALVLKQPDLGTAVMLAAGGAVLFFAAGAPLWLFAAGGAAGLAALPVAWELLHDYQRQRVLTFLDPERDPLGAGYHIIQSKIALGSGGLFGKGFIQGTQSQLNFLPEKQTDFIFTMLAEEFGLIGALALLFAYALVLAYGFAMAITAKHQFGRLLAVGVTSTFFFYAFINAAMVTGLIPVVGVPLPLISYGGTAVLSLMIGFGLLLSVHVHRDISISRLSTGDRD